MIPVSFYSRHKITTMAGAERYGADKGKCIRVRTTGYVFTPDEPHALHFAVARRTALDHGMIFRKNSWVIYILETGGGLLGTESSTREQAIRLFNAYRKGNPAVIAPEKFMRSLAAYIEAKPWRSHA